MLLGNQQDGLRLLATYPIMKAGLNHIRHLLRRSANQEDRDLTSLQNLSYSKVLETGLSRAMVQGEAGSRALEVLRIQNSAIVLGYLEIR